MVSDLRLDLRLKGSDWRFECSDLRLEGKDFRLGMEDLNAMLLDR